MHVLLQHTVSVILGGTSIIGAAIAHDFASKGAKIAIFSHDQIAAWHLVEEIILPGGIAAAFIVNIINKEEIAEAVNVAFIASHLAYFMSNNSTETRKYGLVYSCLWYLNN